MSGEYRDPTVEVRAEDAVDLAALQTWVDAEAGPIGRLRGIRQFPGGASNLTYALTSDAGEFVLRRPPSGRKSAGSHDMGREALFMTALAGRFPVPPVVAQCADPAVLGSPFFVMVRVPGIILRADPPPGVDLGPQAAAALADRMIDLLAELHAIDPAEVGLSGLDKGDGYAHRQVEGWTQRFRTALTDDVPDGEEVIGWLTRQVPADVRRCVIHNDWRFDNLILDPADLSTVRAVLDWELATVGDPLMDVGSALAYWVQADDDPFFRQFRRQPTHLPGMPTRAEFVQRYSDRAGLRVNDFTFYEVYGLFRLAGIAQQIYYRYVHGQTTNPAFAVFGPAVTGLLRRCDMIIAARG